MTVTRADLYTQPKKQPEYFSDFLDSFVSSPVDGSLGKVINANSVKQALKNLVLTNLGERLYQPFIGTNIRASLFEPNDIVTAINIKAHVENVIKNYEPRVKDFVVTVEPSDEGQYMIINIVFYLINNPTPIDLTLNLRRVR